MRIAPPLGATRSWTDAISDCHGLADGSCGLTDGSSAGDWRFPNRKELESLLDLSQYNPALPSGHPFDNVQPSSSTGRLLLSPTLTVATKSLGSCIWAKALRKSS